MNVRINNMPEMAKVKRWIVCRAVDGEVWFYDAWAAEREADAFAQACEVGGFVVDFNDWLEF